MTPPAPNSTFPPSLPSSLPLPLPLPLPLFLPLHPLTLIYLSPRYELAKKFVYYMGELRDSYNGYLEAYNDRYDALSTHPLNPAYQHTLSTQPINTLSQHLISTHRTITIGTASAPTAQKACRIWAAFLEVMV